MANNIPKNDQVASAGTYALYYFPEIPNGFEKNRGMAKPPARFTSSSLEHHTDRPALKDGETLPPHVRERIEAAFAKGREQGHAESEATFQERYQTTLSALHAAVEEMVRAHQQDLQRMERATVRLALTIARTIIGNHTGHEAAIDHVVRKAIEKVVDPRRLTLRLNPADIQTVSDLNAKMPFIDDPDSSMRLQPDQTIQQGGCVIETSLGDVDARIDQQLGIIEELLIAEMAKTDLES